MFHAGGVVSEVKLLGMSFLDNPNPMWVYDLKTLGFLEVNEAAIKRYGFTRQEFLSMTLLDIRPSTDVVPFLHSWAHPKESHEEGWRHKDKSGKVFRVSISSWQLNYRGRQAELVMAKPEPSR